MVYKIYLKFYNCLKYLNLWQSFDGTPTFNWKRLYYIKIGKKLKRTKKCSA